MWKISPFSIRDIRKEKKSERDRERLNTNVQKLYRNEEMYRNREITLSLISRVNAPGKIFVLTEPVPCRGEQTTYYVTASSALPVLRLLEINFAGGSSGRIILRGIIRFYTNPFLWEISFSFTCSLSRGNIFFATFPFRPFTHENEFDLTLRDYHSSSFQSYFQATD